jgi:hypothetical protein
MEVELKGFLLFLFYRGRSVSRIRFMTLIVFSLDGFQSWWFFFLVLDLVFVLSLMKYLFFTLLTFGKEVWTSFLSWLGFSLPLSASFSFVDVSRFYVFLVKKFHEKSQTFWFSASLRLLWLWFLKFVFVWLVYSRNRCGALTCRNLCVV